MQIEDAFFNTSDYKILDDQKIGEGTYGQVFLAQNKKNNKIYAAKILNTSSGFDGRQQMEFLRESLILHSMHHPSILKFQGINFRSMLEPTKLEPTIITEYLSHGSLKDNLDKERSDKPDKNWTLTKKYITLLGVSDAMRCLHEREIIHRDLKSQNILIDNNYYPRICDFGLSRFLPESDDLDMTNGIGTPLYMAPELLDENEDTYGPSVDVYAFGIIIYEVVSGRQPFCELGKMGKFRFALKIINGYRPPLTDNMTNKMKELISRCWSKNIEERPSFKEIYENLSSDFSYVKRGEIDEDEIRSFIAFLDKENKKEEERKKKINRRKESDTKKDDDDDDASNEEDEQTAILQTKNSITYKLHERTRIAEIIKSNEVKGDVIIPSIIKFSSIEYDVIKIDDKAFSGSSIESLSFQSDSSLKIIGNSAFENTKIRKIFIPRSLTKLENLWCQGANELNEIEIDTNNLLFSNRDGFIVYNNDITNQILFAPREFKGDFLVPEGTTKIGEFSFSNRQGLHSIKSSTKTLRSLGSFSFSGCQNLAHLVIKQETSLTLCSFCFWDCKNLLTIEISCRDLEIQNGCFNNCISLSSFKVMKSETIKIHQNSFRNCTNLQEISFNNSNQIQLERNHFECSNKLKTVSFNNVNKVDLDKQAFKNFKALETFSIDKSSEVIIGTECLSESTNLKKLILKSESISFGEDYISKCNSLADVDIRTKSDIIISKNTFESSDLNNITLHSPKVKLFPFCFKGLKNLKSIELQSTIFEVYYQCFDGCQSLTSFSLKTDEISIESSTFSGCNSIKKITLDAKSKLTIPDEFMKGSTSLEHINIGGNQISIGDYCFKDCKSLKTFTIIESNSISLGGQLFINATSLENISIKFNENSKFEFNSNFFNGAKNLKQLYLTGGDIKISNDSFKFCTSLNRLYILKTKKIVISDNQFSNMKLLTNVIIESDSEIDLGKSCFAGAEKLELLTIKGKNVILSNNCFMNCKSISNIIFDDNTLNLTLGTTVFNNCNNLTKICLKAASSLKLSERSFCGSKIKEIEIKGKTVIIENESFSNCSNLNQLKIENVDDLTIGSSAFNKCSNLINFNFIVKSSLTFLEKCFNGSSFEIIELNSQKVVLNNESFFNCSCLKELKIGQVTDITLCTGVFTGCTKLEKLAFDILKTLKINDDCFRFSSVKDTSFQAEEIVTGVNSFKNLPIASINMKSTSIILGNSSFENCSSLQTIKLEASSNLNIGEKCFLGDKSIGIKKFELLGNEINIGKHSFTNCTSIQFLTLQNSRKITIEDNAFEGCINLESITVHSKAEFITGLNCFNKLNKLKTVQITSKSATLGSSCFACCSSLSTFSICGAENAIMHEKTFEDCRNLCSVNFSVSEKFKASGFCFNRASNLKSVVIRSRQIFFGKYCFDKCSSLEQINCPFVTEIKCNETSFNGRDLSEIIKSPNYSTLKIHMIKSDSNDDEYCLIY